MRYAKKTFLSICVLVTLSVIVLGVADGAAFSNYFGKQTVRLYNEILFYNTSGVAKFSVNNSGNVSVAGTMAVTGTTTLTGATTAGTMQTGATTAGTMAVTGTTTLTGATTAGTMQTGATTAGTMVVTGTTTLTGATTFYANVTPSDSTKRFVVIGAGGKKWAIKLGGTSLYADSTGLN